MKLLRTFMLILIVMGMSSISVFALQTGLSIKDAQIIEGDDGMSMMEFTVAMSATPAVLVEFTYSTSDGTAKAGRDYKQTSGKATILAGQKTTTFFIPIINDRKPSKSPKVFTVTIASSKVAVFIAKATGTIVDNETMIGESKTELPSESSKKGKK